MLTVAAARLAVSETGKPVELTFYPEETPRTPHVLGISGFRRYQGAEAPWGLDVETCDGVAVEFTTHVHFYPHSGFGSVDIGPEA